MLRYRARPLTAATDRDLQSALFSTIRMSFVIESENPVVKAVIDGTAPRPAQLAAARGILPLPHQDLLEVLVAFAVSEDSELSGHARQTIRAQDTEMLNGLVRSEEIPVAVLTYLAPVGELPRKLHESIL